MLHQQIDDQLAELRRLEPPLDLVHVVLLGQDAEDRGVGGGPADAVLFERADEHRLGEARRRLGEVLLRQQRVEAERLPRLERRKRRGRLVPFLGVFLARLLIDGEPAGEPLHLPDRAEERLARDDVHRRHVELGGRHLAGDEPVPDELVEVELVRLEVRADPFGREVETRRADRFVGVLRRLALAEVARRLRQVVGAERLPDVLAHRVERLGGDARRVGTHVGDEADRAELAEVLSFVEPLREAHRAGHREAEAARGLLLQLAGRERRGRVPAAPLGLEAGDAEGARRAVGDDGLRGRLVRQRRLLLAPLGGLAPRRVLALPADQLGFEDRAVRRREPRRDGPVLDVLERFDLALALDDHPQRDGLHPPRGEAAADAVPEERRDAVADDPVEDPPRLLRVHLLLVDLAGGVDRPAHRLARDFVEQDPLDRLVDLLLAQQLREVPADRLSLAVRIGREEDRLRLLRRGDDLVHRLDAVLEDLVVRLEPLVLVNADPILVPLLLGVLGQIADVPLRGLHAIVAAEELVDGLRLGGRLDDHEVLCHAATPSGVRVRARPRKAGAPRPAGRLWRLAAAGPGAG